VAFADANRTQIRYIEENSFGVTPGTGTTREVRLTSSSLTANKETVVSDELRSDRMVSDIVEVAASSGGDINFEWSSGPNDEFLAGFLLGAWARPMTMDFWEGVIVSVTGVSTVTVAGRDITGYLTAGRRIKLDGFANPANNGYFEISTVTLVGSNTEVVVTAATLVAESGTVNARLFDANDVIILDDTSISVGATGLDGNATNPFAAAIAAGQFGLGAKVYVDAEDAYEVGTVTLTDPTAMVDNWALVVNDGVNSVTLTATLAAPGALEFLVGVDADTDGAALVAAINALRFHTTPILVNATHNPGDDVVTVTNLRTTGGSLDDSTGTVDANVATVDFAGGVSGVTGIYTVTSLNDDLLGLSPAPAALAAGGSIVVKGSHARNPGDETSIQQRYFSIETAFQDIGQFMEQDGMVAGTFSLEIATGAIVTGTIGFEGRATSLVQSTVLGNTGTYTVLDAQPGDVVNATTDVGDLVKDGVPLLACIQSISLSGEAGLRMQNCVGEKFPRGIGTGRFNLTGSMTVYFENEDLFTDFINHATVSLEFSITDSGGMAYYFNIPSLKVSQDEIAPGGIDQDVFENIEFTAFRDAVTDTMFMIDRFSPNSAT
jgi:hypothetical protein